MTNVFPGQTGFYRGKVRDVYYLRNNRILLIASDRISAFDVILPRPIPYKGQVLTQIAAEMLQKSADICPVWLESNPAPNASLGKKCEPIAIEMVIRGNLTGHAWRTYKSGLRELCGAKMPEGLRENDFFPEPLITPSTKATEGHDEDISPAEIINRGIVSEDQWEELSAITKKLFERGRSIAEKQGLILCDTKYEFGLYDGHIYLMDEIHTPDSSRYFIKEGFEERQGAGEKQQQLSKEFVREWLIANDFMGKEGQSVPEMSDEWVQQISRKYIELYEKLTGKPFIRQELTEEQTVKLITEAL